MNPVSANPLLGVLLHGVGAAFAATCYTPQKQVKRWSWQTYWITQAAFCWFLLPIVGALLTIPDLAAVLREAPREAMWNSFLLGAAYGIGGTAFGISIRYIGFSLTYAIAISDGLGSVVANICGSRAADERPDYHSALYRNESAYTHTKTDHHRH